MSREIDKTYLGPQEWVNEEDWPKADFMGLNADQGLGIIISKDKILKTFKF